MAITSYGKYMDEATSKGKLANYQDYSADTKAAAEVIPFGVMTELTGDGKTVKVFEGGKPYGIAMAQEVHDWVTQADDQKYKTKSPVSVARKGVLWVEALEDVSMTDGVVVDPTTGNFRPADTTTTGVVALPSAAFKTNAKAGGLVQLEINLP
ncbi:structural cement protein Gp24 [Priestia endophytica]|uniref:Uncharacterized protein n=1 Tax=Priestia endophytica TaxID=135735 RepID=A0AAX1Q7H2_9BACI|nr:hypothetical protein [Priestia endophytica]RAS75237.1 hypothetical protein A3864_16355 [Priestia endophytica]